jgi:steroid delta-isomerase-like uncharacterized protein
MSAEENKALARRWAEDIMNQRNLDVVDEIYASDFVAHDPTMPEDIRGVEGRREFYGMYQSAFPDAEITIEDQVAEGDKVVTRWTGRGTHQGELMGVPQAVAGWRLRGSPSAASKAARSWKSGTAMTPWA